MTTNWQDPAATPPPPSAGGNGPGGTGQGGSGQGRGKRFGMVAILLVVIAGLAAAAGIILVNRDADTAAGDTPQYVEVPVAASTPIFEPRDSRGPDPFFAIEVQLATYQEEVEAEIDEQVAAAQADAAPGETVIRPEFDVEALDAAVKTGLYGGTEENTCDPERLISFLYANPDLGEAWAKVQGIEFSEIATYIRSLDVRVLAQPVAVLNHGYDSSIGAAYEINSVLDAGTAVLVDADGNVRARCYCGNPIKPNPPVAMPPRCIVYGAFVFTLPGGTDKREPGSRDVLLTGRQTTLTTGATWFEVKWSNGDNDNGWVRSDNLRTHYCPTPTAERYCPGPGETKTWHSPDMTDSVGRVTGKIRTADATVPIFAPISPVGGIGSETIINDFMLIRFTEAAPSAQNSAWVKLADLNQDSTDCERISQCINTNGPVSERPGGVPLAGADGIIRVEFTGHFAGDPVTHAEVRLLDGTGTYAWVANVLYEPLADEECERVPRDCVEDAVVYETSDGFDNIGWLENADVAVVGGPQDGRFQIMFAAGGPTGWIDAAALFDGYNECKPTTICVTTGAPGWTEFSTSGMSTPAIATPKYIEERGQLAFDGGTPYAYYGIDGVGYWVPYFTVIPRADEDCRPTNIPECPEVQYLTVLDDQLPTPRDARTIDSATESTSQMDDEEMIGRNVCCVRVLYNSPNVGDAVALLLPMHVTVAGETMVAGETWYLTIDAPPFYFRAADVLPASECNTDDIFCPGPYDGPDYETDNVNEDDLEEEDLAVLAILLELDDSPGEVPEAPDTPASADCCVRALYTNNVMGTLIATGGPVSVTVEEGPVGVAPAWFKTTDGNWFPEWAILADDDCRQDVICPTDTPGGYPEDDEDPRNDGGPIDDGFFSLIAATAFSPGPRVICCAAGDVHQMPAVGSPVEGTLMGNEPVVVDDVTDDGTWFHIDAPSGVTGWIPATQFVDLDDCLSDGGGGCPERSVFLVTTTGDGDQTYDCCVGFDVSDRTIGVVATFTGETRDDGAGGLEWATAEDPPTWVPEGTFTDAANCEIIDECPESPSILGTDALTCCVFDDSGAPISVTLTGASREDGLGADGIEYLATDGNWYSDFVEASNCDEDPCAGQALAGGVVLNGECCAAPNEVIQNQCMPPCAASQVRNTDTGACVTPDPTCAASQVLRNGECVTPDPTCAAGQVLRNGECVTPDPTCAAGQVLQDGECVSPGCADRDDDDICDSDDSCPDDANTADADNDGTDDACDPCIDVDRDLFCELPGSPSNDNCWGVANGDQSDVDGDGVGDACDNCINVSNSNQANADGDNRGDACECPNGDTDSDGDGICNNDDNCVNVPNADQSDRDDRDGHGDVCDNCPDVYNPGQANTYGDSRGDACEDEPCGQGDDDGDGACNGEDNCTLTANADQADFDADGVGDRCDNCPEVSNGDQADKYGDSRGDACEEPPCGQGDDDGDGACNGEDNCTFTPNADQSDQDGDATGDSCDNCPNEYNPGQNDPDGDGAGSACDICVDPVSGQAYDTPNVYNPNNGFAYDLDGNDGVNDSCYYLG